jgi:hypothetical protein
MTSILLGHMQTMRIALMLLLQPVLLRRTLGRPWMQWLMLALTVGAILLATLLRAKPVAVLACMVGAAQLLAWWQLFVISIALQCAQRGARRVPRLRRMAVATTVLVWLCLVLIVTLTAGALFGHPVLWALVAGLCLAALALVAAGRETVGFLALGTIPMALTRFQDLARIAAPLDTPAGMAAVATLLGALMYYTVRRLVAGHNGAFLDRWRRRMSGAAPKQVAFTTPFAAQFPGRLRRNRQDLLVQGLGFSRYWTAALSAQIPMLLVSTAMRFTPAANSAYGFGIVEGAMLAPLLILFRSVDRVAAGQPEQALLRLAPRMPASNALNRMLARALLGLFFKNWIAAMACSALYLALTGVSQAQFIQSMASMSVSVLLAGAVLRRYALANKAWDRISLALLYVLTFVLMFFLVPFCIVEFGMTGAQRLGMLLALLAGLLVYWRWRAMLAAPPAFPAGRI